MRTTILVITTLLCGLGIGIYLGHHQHQSPLNDGPIWITPSGQRTTTPQPITTTPQPITTTPQPSVEIMATHTIAADTYLFLGPGNNPTTPITPSDPTRAGMGDIDYFTLLYCQCMNDRYWTIWKQKLDNKEFAPPWTLHLDKDTKVDALKLQSISVSYYVPVRYIKILTGPNTGQAGWIADRELLYAH